MKSFIYFAIIISEEENFLIGGKKNTAETSRISRNFNPVITRSAKTFFSVAKKRERERERDYTLNHANTSFEPPGFNSTYYYYYVFL